MVNIIIFFLVIALIYVITKFSLLKRDINYINKSLELIINNSTNKRITSISMDRNLIKVIGKINFLIDENEKNRITRDKNEKKLKQVITDISHDLRTPLTSIRGYIQYINNKDMDNDSLKKYMKIINDKAIILQELLESFFDLSRIESNNYPIKLEEVNIYVILTNVLASFYNDFMLKGIEPKLNIEKENILGIADEKAIRRVFINLFQNILKHNGNDVEVDLHNENGVVIINFKNKVEELSKEDVEKLFDKFFIADKMRSNKNSGLGLTICKELVERMEGSISANLYNDNLRITVKLKKK